MLAVLSKILNPGAKDSERATPLLPPIDEEIA